MRARSSSPSLDPSTMKTHEQGYSDYLQNKYLPGRTLYLRWFFYPKLFRRFNSPDTIIDLGCGTGEFLNYARKRKQAVLGVDSNEALANRCRNNGFDVRLDNVCQLASLKGQQFKYAVCDNVLEHLDMREISQFFDRLETLLTPGGVLICVVPGRRGFKCDPTHKTFVCPQLLDNLFKGRSLRVETRYYHPLNMGMIDQFSYLNMQVFEVVKI